MLSWQKTKTVLNLSMVETEDQKPIVELVRQLVHGGPEKEGKTPLTLLQQARRATMGAVSAPTFPQHYFLGIPSPLLWYTVIVQAA